MIQNLKKIYHKIVKILGFFKIDFINTIRINAKLPLKQAIKLPILLYNSRIDSLRGQIIIDNKDVCFNMISLGKRSSILNIRKNGIGISLSKGSTLIFKGPGYMGNDSSIETRLNGELTFEKNFGITSNFKIACEKNIIIGDNFSSSWEVGIYDTDFHNLYNLENKQTLDSSKAIFIGSDVWVCNRSLILKGSYLPDRSIVSSNSLVNKNFENKPKNSIYAGVPAKLIKTGYTRKEFIEFEKEPIINIVRYLNL